MSDEIKADYIPGGALDRYIKDEAGDHWYPVGQVFEVWGGGAGRDATDYAVALIGDASGSFVGNFDTNISIGHYYVTTKIRAGAGAVASDIVHGNGEIWWNGTSEETQAEYELKVYDAPTNAEMELRTLLAADYTIVSDLGTVQSADHTAGIADIPTVAEFNARTLVSAGYASPTNITAGVITTVTNLTNAATAGDFNATQKTSLNNATPAVTVSDKTEFSLSTAGVKAIWDQLTSATTAIGSMGKKLADWVVGTIDTYTGNTKQTADHTAAIAAIPTTAMRGTDSANTIIPDVAGTAAALHTTTRSLITTVDTVVDAIKVTTDRLSEMLVIDGVVYQFTANALELTPIGSATLANQVLILEDIVDIKGTGFVKDTNSLVNLPSTIAAVNWTIGATIT